MNDLISRRAAIDALEEPCKVSDTWTDEYAVGERMQWEKDVRTLNSLPTIDAVEVVRCKDCQWWDDNYRECGSPNWYPNQDECVLQPAGMFCGWGERRTNVPRHLHP